MSRTPPNAYVRPWPTGRVATASDPAGAAAADLMAKVAHQIANARRDRFTTQEALAKKAGVSRYTLSRIEAGSTWSDLAVLMRVCAALDLELDLRHRESGRSVYLPGVDAD